MSSADNNKDSVIILCGHGSRLKETESEFADFVAAVAARTAPLSLDYAFLEFNRPPIGEKLAELYAAAYRRFACVPIMLLDGAHVRRDIPTILGEFLAANPDASGVVAADFGLDERLLAVAESRVATVLAANRLAAADCGLLIVGRGNSNRALNRKVADIGETLGNRLGMKLSLACFSGIARPNCAEGLRLIAARTEVAVVLPYLLFVGKLLGRVKNEIAIANDKLPARFYCAEHLGPEAEIADLAAENGLKTLASLWGANETD